MNNKNIIAPKYKKSTPDDPKTGNRPLLKEAPKLTPHYSASSILRDANKNYRPNAISRHASEEEFRRKLPAHIYPKTEHHLISA